MNKHLYADTTLLFLDCDKRAVSGPVESFSNDQALNQELSIIDMGKIKEIITNMESFDHKSPIMELETSRFPGLVQEIFKHLDNTSLINCKKASRTWNDFVGNQKFYGIRKIKRYKKNMDEFDKQLEKVLKKCPENTWTHFVQSAICS